KGSEGSTLIERFDRHALALASEDRVRLGSQEITNLFRHHAVGRIQRTQGVGYHALLGWTNWVGRLCGSGVNGRRGRLTRKRCRSRRCRRSPPGQRRARRDCGRVTPFCEDVEEGSKNHGKSKSHARQDAVATRAVHTAQVSTSSPATSRISEAGAICVSDARLQ